MLDDSHRQEEYAVRLDWGLSGARAVCRGVRIAVVVDVLSFTTAVTVGVERGTEVLPYRWRDDTATGYAEAHGALLARGRREGLVDGSPSLSPASLTGLQGGERLVLPSPNGSTISLALSEAGASVVAASLRNAAAVARRLVPRVSGGVAVIAAGEQWPDGSLRPAVEDLWGAGAVISALLAAGVDGVSPEARSAAAAYDAVADRLCVELAACASGRELVGSGFAQDVALAAELDASPVVPVLPPGERGFRAAPTAGW